MSDVEGKTNVGKPRVKWALKHDRCVRCGRDDIRHIAQGLCVTCYEKETQNRSKGYRPRKRSQIKELTKDYLRTEYVKKKRSMIDIAKELGCTRQAIFKALKRFGIDSRNLAEASDLALRRGKKKVRRIDESGHQFVTTLDKIDVNEDFFSIWLPGMAYVLGVIYTDGWIIPGYNVDPRRSGRSVSYLGLAQKEPELLQKVLALMDCNAKLRHSKERRYGSVVAGALYSFEISSETMYRDLLSLGVTPNKSLTLTFPQMPGRELIRHFVRGCWDGDGTVYVPRDGNKARAYAGILSGSQKFITGLVDHLYRVGIKRRSGECLSVNRHKNAYIYRIKGRDNLTLFFHYLYGGVDSSIRLERKYLKFLEIMRLYDELPRPAKANDLVEAVLDELQAKQIEIKPVQDLLISLWYKGKRFMFMEPIRDFLVADVLTPGGSWSGRKTISGIKEWDVVYYEYVQKYIEYADEQ